MSCVLKTVIATVTPDITMNLMDLNLLSGLSQRDAASGFRGELLLGSRGCVNSLFARKEKVYCTAE